MYGYELQCLLACEADASF